MQSLYFKLRPLIPEDVLLGRKM